MRKVFILLLIFPVCVSAQKKTKIACLGNSVTFGYLLPDREKACYPSQLQKLLGNDYDVKNFGKSGATLLSKGHRPYIEQEEYIAALNYAADIVIIHLGLNDTDPRNWPNYKDDFFIDYLNLIDSFRKVNPKCEIWICRMSPITYKHTRFISGTRDWYAEIQKKIELVADYAHVGLIDFEEKLFHRPDLLPDALHPNAEGAKALAETVYSTLTGNYGGLRMSVLYTDNMVLQRNRYLKVQGIANSKEEVTVEIGVQKHATVAKINGKWEVTLDPLSTGETYTLKISTKNKTLKYNNVVVGEVWLCSGQSNMAFYLNNDADFKKNDRKLNNKNIRFFDMKPKWETNAVEWDSIALKSLNRLQYFEDASWTECTPGSAAQFSAVGYYFGRMLADSLDVPIGLIHNAVGGAPIESWIDRKTLEFNFPEILKDWMKNDFIQDWVRGRAILNIRKSADPDQRHPYEPAYLFESGILSLKEYPINGVIWYQGESNAHNIEAFERLFPLFVSSWRSYWNMPRLPFLYVQLSSLNRPSWTWFRDSQRKLMDKIPDIYMTVSSDKGDSLDVHPYYKKDIGERLAFWALNKEYDKNHIIPSGPLYRSAEYRRNNVLISFDYSQGMHASIREDIIGFELAEIDGLYHPAKAEVVNDKVKVSSEKVKNPRYVRYGWQPFTRANLVNRANLPASTFKTEEKTMKDIKEKVRCESLPDYPVEGGVSGVFIGVHHDKLIIVGGCNFSDKPAKAGGEKMFYDDVYLLDISEASDNKKWVKCLPFPHKVAYGTAVSTDEGIICIGGQNKTSALSDVILIQYDNNAKNLQYKRLPSLPVNHFNGSATILDNIIYVAGGISSDKNKGVIYYLDLKNKISGWRRIDSPYKYERQQPVLVAQEGCLFLAGGYDEQTPKVFTDVMKFDFKSNQWIKFSNIEPDGGDLKTFVGAYGVPFGTDKILFTGGVDYERFDSALKRIKKMQEAIKSEENQLASTLKEVGKEYMSQNPEWYKFKKDLTFFDVRTGCWHSFGDYPELARAGAGVILWNDKLYIVCGELKPGVRSAKVNSLIVQ
ncbi:cyclically-permuted mutarotase family protein [Parabacteroides sp. Marseille-P3160]|uniref:cyclically-permuted mutarotase family protein n=1 Tax=Parabacteroides sp. Marseille-P3160 TaxID=1917887 RepID=UPI0009B96B97|nr:cyclically-permuted mutarotase family protein [Parabacteroides sp. Marseille-P3160]